jgi:RNA polymerase sigma-70 factor (ECF subfamily)
MPSEADLLTEARRFEADALGQIYDRFSPALYRYALRLLGQPDVAEECVAETFSRFLLALRRGGGPTEHLQAYLYRVAHNWITDQWRRQPLPPLSLDADLTTEPRANRNTDPAEAALQQVGSTHVRAALARLTPDQRQVIMLKYLEDWDNREIAAALDKPLGSIKALQHRALAALRRLLFNEERELHETA